MNASPHLKKVMLVDDTESLRFALGRVLRLYGFDVCEAVHGRDALDHLDAFRPDLILTDIMMPVMDGIALIRELQQTRETSSIPVVAITASPSEKTGDSARKAGALEVLSKPLDLPFLVDRLKGYFAMAG